MGKFELARWLRAGFAIAMLAAVGLAPQLATAAGPAGLMTRDDMSLGTILTDSQGMTLYMYTKDAPGISTCYQGCAAAWPPLLTDGAPVAPDGLPGVFSTTVRTDGTTQVTYNGMPLYYWASDTQPGDTTGQNVGGVWFVVNPAPAPTVNVRQDGALGSILTDASGMTLYRYTKDQPGLSTCNDSCATAWPPLLLSDGDPTGPAPVSSDLGTIMRADGSRQVTYDGMPLYYWAKDAKPGDTTGQNVGGVWFVVSSSAGDTNAGGSGGSSY